MRPVQLTELGQLFMGTITHVGYWTGPYGHIFPVYEWSDGNTRDKLAPYIGTFHTESFVNTSIGISSVKGTYYGEMVAKALELQKETSNSTITTYEEYGDNGLKIIDNSYHTRSSSTTYRNQGYRQIWDTVKTSEYFNATANFSISNNIVKDDIIFLGDGGGRVGIILLKYTDGDKVGVLRVNGNMYLDGTVSNGYPIEYDISISFASGSNRTGCEFLFGLKNGLFTDDPIGKFTPGTTPPGSNPYEPGGDSGEGGGGGSFDGDSDQISDSSLPTLSAADTGFTRLYTPTLSQVQDLARYLWTDESIIETLWNVVKRYFEDPMQAFISFSIVPVPVPVAGVEDFKVLFIPTGVMLNTVANQFVDVDCGTFEMKEYYGSALDYSPNTKVSCYLPYIGTVSLNTDDVMGRTLQVKYRVDICSGSCVAKILVDGNVIYQFPGCCSVPIPFTSADFSSYGSAIISAVKTGVALAAAGAGATELGANIIGMNASQQTGESYTKTTVDTVRNPATGRQITAGTQKITKEVTGTKASFSGIAQTGLANTANSVTASKTIVERSGSFSGNSGYLGVRRPYLIIERPRMCMPTNYQQLNGFPSMMTMALSECKGYTRVQQIQLTGVEATNPEQAEILELLKGGVIL